MEALQREVCARNTYWQQQRQREEDVLSDLDLAAFQCLFRVTETKSHQVSGTVCCVSAHICLHSTSVCSAAGPVVGDAAEGSSHGTAGFGADGSTKESSSALPVGSDLASACITHPHAG